MNLSKALLVILVILSATHYSSASRGIRLQAIRFLEFSASNVTTTRHGQPKPKLQCVGDTFCDAIQPQHVFCANIGFVHPNVVWQCNTNLPKGYSLDQVEVSCEGYGFAGNQFVLDGSCALRYAIAHESPPSRSICWLLSGTSLLGIICMLVLSIVLL